MCGIAGFWARQALGGDVARGRLEAMRDTMCHRGPDDAGTWIDGAVAFGHRRLSIVDLSPLGHQPMTSPDGRFTICFNGEVFNFQALRDELAARGHAFRGGSDTEVMLAAFTEWGVVPALERFVGMFAFAVWDARERALHLVRDRMGIKPLFVGRTPSGDVVFASELKALMAYPGFERRIDPDAVAAYLRYSYVPSPQSIFLGARKLQPGHVLTLGAPSSPLDSAPYWSLSAVAREGERTPFTGSAADAEEALDTLLREVVGLRMIADVPLGAFLSGGIDSSLVVALMQAQSARPVRTFTIGFMEARYDESAHARAVAAHLGTEHTEQRVTPDEAMAVIPRLATMYDEPLADVSQIPTFLVSALARRHVTVALSGDGGDELFGGYERYRFAPRAWWWVQRVPRALRRPGARALRGLAGARLGALGGAASRARKSADLLEAPDLEAVYRRLVSTTAHPLAMTTLGRESDGPLSALLRGSHARTSVERMMLADTMVYLPDDLLTKLDRASMAVGLEGRVPLLDHRVAAFAWRLPVEMRRGKMLLRRVLGRYVPSALVDRPKMGFEVPIGEWLRGPLRPWADGLLEPRTLAQTGIFDVSAVRRTVQEHDARRTDAAHLLWSILMFEAWRRHWGATL
ncbi:MAG TPA: asparagine synthase (glutamine-hydrolyzing) [Gemmatimonadaceae bacterium]|nr:asparagine synthase (glutamine-hydrolyzing) [Gemmatimonadaceae bacterium]